MKLLQLRKHWGVFVLGSLLAGVGIIVFRSKTPSIPIQSSAQFLPADSKIPAQPLSFFDRHVPISWVGLWRLHDIFRGPLATILIDAEIIDCTEISDSAMATLLLEPPLAETNGLRGWILDGQTLTDLKRQIEQMGGRVMNHPRVQTAHAIQSSMSVGNTIPVSGALVQVGLAMDLLPLIQPDGTDLISALTVTEAITNRLNDFSEIQATTELQETKAPTIVTNLHAAARWKLPDGRGIFIFGPVASNDLRRIGVIVSATVQRPKK